MSRIKYKKEKLPNGKWQVSRGSPYIMGTKDGDIYSFNIVGRDLTEQHADELIEKLTKEENNA